MRFSQCVRAFVIAFVLMSVSTAAQGHPSSLTPESDFKVRHVHVLGGDSFGTQLSGRIIAFEGLPVNPGDFPEVKPIYFHDIATGETFDTGYVGGLRCFDYPTMVISQMESWHGDLNNDGDQDDILWVVYNVRNREGWVFAENIRLSVLCASSDYVVYRRIEPYDRVDYNGDGDIHDNIGFLYDIDARQETVLGVGTDPLMYGRFAVWFCREDAQFGICYRDVESGSQRTVDLSTDYPEAHIYWYDPDSNLFVFSLSYGGDEWLAFLNMSTGELVVDRDVGIISGVSLEVSEGKILACNGYPLPWRCFIYDTSSQQILRYLDDTYMRNLRLYDETVIFNDHGGEHFPESEPPPLANVVIYDTKTGERADTGLDGYIGSAVPVFDGNTIVVNSNEKAIGSDLNRDGDMLDPVVAYVTSVDRIVNWLGPFVLVVAFAAVGVALLVYFLRKYSGKER